MRAVTLAERPDLSDATFAIPYGPDAARFMQGSPIPGLVRRSRFIERWPEYVFALLGSDARPMARGVALPFAADVDGRQRYPDGGWDQVAIWAVEDVLDGRSPDTLCALEIAVHPQCYGQGLSGAVLSAMRQRAREARVVLVAPVRPPDKAAEPHTEMLEYATRRRSDGLPADRWLRVHVRAGGTIEGIARCSATVQAPLRRWRTWTGLPFDVDGPVAVPGGLVPVFVSRSHDVGVYVEPNVWVRHG